MSTLSVLSPRLRFVVVEEEIIAPLEALEVLVVPVVVGLIPHPDKTAANKIKALPTAELFFFSIP
jgi:hypothetical protein